MATVTRTDPQTLAGLLYVGEPVITRRSGCSEAPAVPGVPADFLQLPKKAREFTLPELRAAIMTG